MCACEPGWTCPRCRDTPSDHRYELDERISGDEFSAKDAAGEPFTEKEA